MGATTMISERPNSRRGSTRLSARNGCSCVRTSVRRVLFNAVWDQDIADTANGLDIKRQLGIFFDLAPKPGDLHVHRALQSDIQARAECAARKGTSCIAGKKLQQLRLAAGQPHRLAIAAQFGALEVEHAGAEP